ncbi:MAG: DUF1361 domain-containing protein [Cyanobacteria bacterium SW_12_48_29]|jgi:uncharacterized membrane protein|nr:MAG: DUF1361 domain-containing protein [Cyanobacteria bacterium QH_2_48_84]PSO76020.1 MAG: DUF1361 domain-containing protein [Cyanobacteria bacterium QS_4_48_99]PSO81387.1 MAG: DUF1361 domain-containing protein [Cyanobacteria bacterium QS_5_48_63]PSO90515.1 MAG: DUF1361 domain-containing protein [Cyanobacteria bacterium QS_6_48_18]PSP04458.1 MAG: DUF1361 domain-containing protein [Cyanobacteria bacterium SW_12_48_29]PSP11595.1 MAG: DUF1361 domain-containing protein [Cyanobacteria bacterium 
MESTLVKALEEFEQHYSGWIFWNLFLAFIPLALSFWLFRGQSRSRSFLWWIGLIVFIAFLPNAPYMLTDVIHLIAAIRSDYSVWEITLIFIPLHVSAILCGFEAYVISLINQGHYLKQQGAGKFVVGSELLVHALCAVGIFLGRFLRFNSWDIVTNPDVVLFHTIDYLTDKRPLLVIGITFVVLAVSYWIMKQLTLGVLLRIRYASQRSANQSKRK